MVLFVPTKERKAKATKKKEEKNGCFAFLYWVLFLITFFVSLARTELCMNCYEFKGEIIKHTETG